MVGGFEMKILKRQKKSAGKALLKISFFETTFQKHNEHLIQKNQRQNWFPR
jgi:hypothetical protein